MAKTTMLMMLVAVGLTAAVAQKFGGSMLPGMEKARVSTNEASAVASLRVIVGAEASYSTTCTSGGFAVSLDDLSKPLSGQDVAFISSDLGKNGIEKSGYRITVEKDAKPGVSDLGTAASTCNGAAANPASSYFVSAEPATPGSTGTRYFATDARGIVFASAEPIANPIVESDGVKPVRGGELVEKPADASPDSTEPK